MMNKKFFLCVSCCLCLISVLNAGDSEDGYFASLLNGIKKTWKSDKYELIIPVNTWHNRLTYSSEDYDKYNEMPWGLGLDKYYIDEHGNKHQLYAIVFSDSHYKPEPSIGYTWQRNWYLNSKRDFSVGLGYNLMITARHEYLYIPFPAPLPLFSIDYKRISVQINYIPYLGSYGGDVFFTIAKWKL